MKNSQSRLPTYLIGAGEVPQDWPRLRAYLLCHGLILDEVPPPRQFAAGFGNLNFCLSIDGKEAVLRRPPLGPIPPGGNDMARESRIISALSTALPTVPRCIHSCADPEVLGAPFFIMEFRSGIVIGGDLPSNLIGWSNADGVSVGEHLGHVIINTLAALHDVNPTNVGLDSLGRPEGFLQRTARNWIHRADLAWEGKTPSALHELVSWISQQAVPNSDNVFIHNDFKLDNVILDDVTLTPSAIIDWDMGTQGDPLYDLSTLLSYWTEPGDPQAVIDMDQMPTTDHGFPTRYEAAQLYAESTGRDLSEIQYRRVVSIIRTASVFRQLYRRYTSGGTDDPRFLPFGHVADGLLEFGVEVAYGRCF